MRVLVVGSGGREHALAWAISVSPLVDSLFCAPGNAGIAEEAECVAIAATDIKGLVGFCRRERIDFVVVGPEAARREHRVEGDAEDRREGAEQHGHLDMMTTYGGIEPIGFPPTTIGQS